MKNSAFFGFLIYCIFLFGCASTQSLGPKGPESKSAIRSNECEIGIVGGGPAGVYLAYRLSPKHGNQICLFEKESELGGRMRDETFTTEKGAVSVGTGARRVNETQKFVLNLARELEVELETPEPRSQLMLHKGRHGFSPDEFVDMYPRLTKPTEPLPGVNREDFLYTLLLSDENTAKAHRYSNLKNYIAAIAGPDAAHFLRGASRFHADFDYDISASNYLSTIKEEFKLSAVNLYPVGGMSVFVKKMEAKLIEREVRVFKSHGVLEINRSFDKAAYRLRTTKGDYVVKRLVIAAPPNGIDKIMGDVAVKVRAASEYKALLPIRIVVINQVWKDSWWKNSKVWRAWSTDGCVTHTEIPQEKYLSSANVTRSVYSDDPKCVKFWESLLARGGIISVEKEVVKGLTKLFDHKLESERVKLSTPLRTTMHVWPGGWYYIRAGTKVSNQQITEWAVQPISDQENVMLVGEAYWPDRPGWSEGAYFSAEKLLDARFK